MNRIKKLLNDAKGISAWKLAKVRKRSAELFYVLDKLETNRASDTTVYEVTVYVDKGELRGSSNFVVYPHMSETEVEAKISEHSLNASLALNKFYELPKPEDVELEKTPTNLEKRPFSEIIEDVKNAVFKANVYKQGYLAATEFFLYKTEVEIANSSGVCLSSIRYKGNVELIPSWDENGEEVEIYHMMSFLDFDSEKVTAKVDSLLLEAKARCEATAYKGGELPVILESEEIESILSSFVSELSYQAKYTHSNHFELGDLIQKEDIEGDRFDISLLPYFQGADSSAPFDADGVILKPLKVIEDGKAIAMHGPYRFGYYLGVDKPTGSLPILLAKEGKMSFDDMKKSPYLRCAKFSGIQVDMNSGFFGGEVRLGYYYDGEKEIPVTGFSISGNIYEAKDRMHFSKECETTSSYHGPKYLYIKGMKIA